MPSIHALYFGIEVAVSLQELYGEVDLFIGGKLRHSLVACFLTNHFLGAFLESQSFADCKVVPEKPQGICQISPEWIELRGPVHLFQYRDYPLVSEFAQSLDKRCANKIVSRMVSCSR